MNKNILIVIVAMMAGLIIGFGSTFIKVTSFGGLIHNVVETFIPGIIIGSEQEPACIKVMDTDKGGWTYITYLNGVETTTGGTAGAFEIPDACVGK